MKTLWFGTIQLICMQNMVREDIMVGNSFADMYAKCSQISGEEDILVENTLFAMCGKCNWIFKKQRINVAACNLFQEFNQESLNNFKATYKFYYCGPLKACGRVYII